jgi:nicotinamide riboside transporter PnuC
MIELVGWATTVLAVWGVLLNNRRKRVCFVLWLFSNALSAAVHICLSVWSLAVRDAVFFVLAVEGLILWGKNDTA